MQKVIFAIGVSLVSLNCFAGNIAADSSATLKGALQNSLQQPNSTSLSTIMYGGQDISRPLMAVADESLWKGNDTFTG